MYTFEPVKRLQSFLNKKSNRKGKRVRVCVYVCVRVCICMYIYVYKPDPEPEARPRRPDPDPGGNALVTLTSRTIVRVSHPGFKILPLVFLLVSWLQRVTKILLLVTRTIHRVISRTRRVTYPLRTPIQKM